MAQLDVVTMEEIATNVQSGFASGERTSAGVVQLRMNNVTTDGNLDWSSYIRIPATPKQVEKFQLRLGDIVFNSTNSPELVGKTTIFNGFKEPVVFSNHFVRLRVDETRVDPQYLVRWFTLQWQKRIFGSLSTQWVNQAAVRKEDLLALKLSLPPLAEQRRIADILARADRLRRLRRTARRLGETYLQSVFVEMFGEPKTNPKGWKKLNLGDLIISAQDGPHVSPKYCNDGIPFLSTRNIRPGEVVWEDLKYISLQDANKFWKRSGSKPERGDILYTKGGSTGLAKAVDFDQQVAVWVHITVLKLRKDLVVPKWLENMLNSDYCYKQSQELTFGIVNRDLGLKRMVKIDLYLPPLDEQIRFATIVQRYEHLRLQQREAERQAEMLFQGLLQRAFAGEG